MSRRRSGVSALNFKVVSAKHDVWSARVTDDFRVLGKRNGKTITWFWIGRHAEYDQLLNKL